MLILTQNTPNLTFTTEKHYNQNRIRGEFAYPTTTTKTVVLRQKEATLSIFDPTYGELLSAKEVCEATGFTMNQLRNWRMPARLEKAPFGFVSIGISPYYRKASVQKWLDSNAGSNVRYTPAGTDLEIPIDTAYEGDSKRANAMRMIGSITPENVSSVFDRLSGQDRALVSRYANIRKQEFLFEELGQYDPMTRPITRDNRFVEPSWFTAMVKAMRLAQNEIANLGFSEAEVLALPVGDVPPVRETK